MFNPLNRYFNKMGIKLDQRFQISIAIGRTLNLTYYISIKELGMKHVETLKYKNQVYVSGISVSREYLELITKLKNIGSCNNSTKCEQVSKNCYEFTIQESVFEAILEKFKVDKHN